MLRLDTKLLERLTVKDDCLEIVSDIAGDVETFNGGVEIATEEGECVVRCVTQLMLALMMLSTIVCWKE